MKVSEAKLIDCYIGLTNAGQMISDIDGQKIVWQYDGAIRGVDRSHADRVKFFIGQESRPHFISLDRRRKYTGGKISQDRERWEKRRLKSGKI